MTRGGYRGEHAVKKSRKIPTTKVSAYEICRDNLNEISAEIGIPVVEIIYRVLNNKGFPALIDDIKANLSENWAAQNLEDLKEQ